MSVQNTSRPAQSGVIADEIPMAGHTMAEKVGQARELAGELYRGVKSRAMEKEAQFEGYVKEHPVKSVLTAAGIGAGVGIVLGVLLARR